MNMTWVSVVNSLGLFSYYCSAFSPPPQQTACKVGNKASDFRCNTRIWNPSNLRQPGNYSFADGKLSEGNGKMNHKRCGVGVKAPRQRQIFSVTNPGPFFSFSLNKQNLVPGL